MAFPCRARDRRCLHELSYVRVRALYPLLPLLIVLASSEKPFSLLGGTEALLRSCKTGMWRFQREACQR